MADHPLRSATDRRLGEPLPHQPANQTQAHPLPINLWPLSYAGKRYYEVLIIVSNGYPSAKGRLPTRYSPVRRFPLNLSSEESVISFSLDLHVLGTPPAFILSQDQTLYFMVYLKALASNYLCLPLPSGSRWLLLNALRLCNPSVPNYCSLFRNCREPSPEPPLWFLFLPISGCLTSFLHYGFFLVRFYPYFTDVSDFTIFSEFCQLLFSFFIRSGAMSSFRQLE